MRVISKVRPATRTFMNYSTCALAASYWRHAKSVFVMSTGRTGTETLARLLDLSPHIEAFHEPPPQLLAERKEAFGQVWARPRKFARIFSHARAWPIAKSRFRNRLYAEASARLTFFAPVIANVMPEAKFVCLYRHAADVVRSGMRREWYTGHMSDRHRIEPWPDDPAFDSWQSWAPFERICWYWDAYNRFALQVRERLGSERILMLRSEDLFDVQTEAYDALLRFLDLPTPARDKISSVLAVKHNAQVQNEFPKLENWSVEQRETLDRIAGQTMRTLGYV